MKNKSDLFFCLIVKSTINHAWVNVREINGIFTKLPT